MISTKRINEHGDSDWRLPNRLLHREDGPAYVARDGYQAWYINGNRHREDGPAIIWPDGVLQWYLGNQRMYTLDEYCDELRRKYGKTDEDIMILKMQYETH